MSALSTSDTRGAFAARTSTACLTTAITSSHSPSTLVNIAFVSQGNSLSRTTRTASATAALTLSESPPAGATLNATNTPAPLPVVTVRRGPCRYRLVTSSAMSHRALPFDPIARAAELWADQVGPATTMAAVTSIMRVQQVLQSAVDSALRPPGLTFARYEGLLLPTFSQRGSLPMRGTGERLQLHPTSVTNSVDRLEADGLVNRLPHPTDRRTTLAEITEAGRERRESATKAVTEIDFGLRGLTERQTE